MSLEITVPALGESVSEATVSEWLKSQGDRVETDETVLVLETDKVSLEVYAPASGILSHVEAPTGAQVKVGSLLGKISQGDTGVSGKDGAGPESGPESGPSSSGDNAPRADSEKHPDDTIKVAPASVRSMSAPPMELPAGPSHSDPPALSPSVRKMVADHNLDPVQISGSGKGGRLTKSDVQAHIDRQTMNGQHRDKTGEGAIAQNVVVPVPAPASTQGASQTEGPHQERVPMTRLRRRIAERLKAAQNTAAILTTFNEVDMTNVIAVRKAYRDVFEEKHSVRLGFMSFFVRAALVALKEFPNVNAQIDGDDILYKNFYHIGVAVGSQQGLVVPVLRDADRMNFSGIEKAINAFSLKAQDGKLSPQDLADGTFTISNGGVYGSLMSTPILNPPQSAILGMHKTQMRPVVVGDAVVARPMMYLALSYDHRIIDGREAVSFLVTIKNCIEDPQRILLDI